MTARTKHGYKGHSTHHADHGTPHQRLMQQHTTGARPGGAPMMAPTSAAGPTGPGMMGPPMGGAPAMAPPGAGPDDEEDSQS
jgi:hypothetical protein